MMRAAFVALMVLGLVGCEDDKIDSSDAASNVGPVDAATAADTDPASDSMAGDSAGVAACPLPPAAGAQCNTQANVGSAVVMMPMGTATPTGTGGTIADGRYALTTLVGYMDTPLKPGQTLRQTVVICGGAFQFVDGLVNEPPTYKNFTISPSGTDPGLTQLCTSKVSAGIPYASYTATPTSLTLYSTVAKFSVTYTMQ